MVQHKKSMNLYALKYINKARCVKMKAVPNIIQERRLLEEVSTEKNPYSVLIRACGDMQVDHPFVVNLRYAFQDDENCFFVLDLMLGGDLRCQLYIFTFHACCRLKISLQSSLRAIEISIRGYSTIICGRDFQRANLSSREENSTPRY